MWVDYWGAKGYVGPPLKLLGGLPPAPPRPLFLRLWHYEVCRSFPLI